MITFDFPLSTLSIISGSIDVDDHPLIVGVDRSKFARVPLKDPPGTDITIQRSELLEIRCRETDRMTASALVQRGGKQRAIA